MTETPNLTLEKKEKNKQFILDNLDKYVVDVHGNFFNIDPEMLGREENSYIAAGGLTPEGNKEIREKIGEMILREIKDWELVFDEVGNIIHYKCKKSGREIHNRGLGSSFEMRHRIIGELGYRKNVWKDYEEWKKILEEREKWFRENITNNKNPQSTPPKPEPKKSTSPLPNQPNPPKDNSNKPTKNSPSNQENNSPLPPPADIQTHYKTDRAQTEITNNPNLANNLEKQQAQELLKIIITAELLIKEAKTNSEILTKLLKEKKQNSSVYQLLNKEKRIDQAINQLQNMEKNHNPAPNNQNQPNKNSSPFKIIIPIGLSFLAIVGIGIAVLVRRKKKRNN